MLHVKELSFQKEQSTKLTISDRLPQFLAAPCQLHVAYQVEAIDDYYLIHLRVDGILKSICQRCIHEFHYPYTNETQIAVCSSEARAESLLLKYECIVSENYEVDLEDLIIDELHLYGPQFHPDERDCDSEIIHFLDVKKETE